MNRNEPEQNPDLFPNRTKPSRNIPACKRETMRHPVDSLSGGRGLLDCRARETAYPGLQTGNGPFHAMVAA
jgi:hypothetical protein